MKKAIHFFVFLYFVVTTSSCKKNEDSNTVFQDNLSTSETNWSLASTSNSERNFSNGHYIIRVVSSGYDSWSLAPTNPINFPYAVQVDGTSVLDNPSMEGAVGIIFNYIDSNNHSGAEIYSNGWYRIWTIASGNVTNVAESDNINIIQGSGAKNTIKIIQHSASTDLYINNSFIGNFNIQLPSGTSFSTGIFTGAPSNYFTPVTGEFNNFKLTRN